MTIRGKGPTPTEGIPDVPEGTPWGPSNSQVRSPPTTIRPKLDYIYKTSVPLLVLFKFNLKTVSS